MNPLYQYMPLGFLILLIILIILFFLYCKKCNNYWKNRGVATLKPKLLFGNLGNVLLLREGLFTNVHNFCNTLKLSGQRFGGYYFFMRPVLIIFDADLVKQVLIQDFGHFTDRPLYYNEHRDPLSAHLIALKGERWRNLRAKLSPAFTSGKFKMMFDNIVPFCDQLAASIDRKTANNRPLDIYDEIDNVIIDMIGSCCFGIDCHSTENSNSEFKYYGKEYLHNPSFLQAFLFLVSGVIPEFFDVLNINLHSKKMTEFFINLVRKIVTFREENNVVRNDLMHTLLQIKNHVTVEENNLGNVKSQGKNNNDKKSLTINEIAAQCFVFFLAGFDTTSSALSFCIYELSLNTVIQDTVREEVLIVLKKNHGKLTYDLIQEMKFLDMCLNETLRKYPSVAGIIRVCTQTYKVPNSNVVIEKGTMVYIPIVFIHHNSEYHANPNLFDPARFSDDNKGSSNSWLPFGQGPRTCIGYRLALMQMKVILVTLLKRYRFSLHHSTKIPINFNQNSILLAPASKILVCMEKI